MAVTSGDPFTGTGAVNFPKSNVAHAGTDGRNTFTASAADLRVPRRRSHRHGIDRRKI
jgi:hypothetical protein